MALVEVSCSESVESLIEDVPVGVEERSTELPVIPTDKDELSTPVVTAPTAELLLGAVEVASVGFPVTS